MTPGVCRICNERPRRVNSSGKVHSYCRQCDTEKAREYARANRDEINARRKERYWSDPEYRAKVIARDCARAKENRAAITAKARERREANPRKYKDKRLKESFGIPIELYEAMLGLQGGGCAICRIDLAGLNKKHVHVDHDHVTGRVRAILCHHCNVGIGHFKDDPGLLHSAINYLRRHAAFS